MLKGWCENYTVLKWSLMSTCRAVSNKKIATNQQGCGILIFATQIIKIDDSKATQRADLKSVHLLVNHDEQHGTKKRTNFEITHNNTAQKGTAVNYVICT